MPDQLCDFGLKWSHGDAGFYAADDVKPTHAGFMYESTAGQDRHGFDREIKVGRGAGEAITEEVLGDDACDGDRLCVDPECAANDGWVAGVVVLSGVVAHNGDEWCADNIVRVCEETSDARLQAEGAEVVTGDEFAPDGASALLSLVASSDDLTAAGLHGG